MPSDTTAEDLSLPGLVPVRRQMQPRRIELYVGVGLILAVVLACWVIPIFDKTDPNALVAVPLQPPSAEHPFGTDMVGRDVFIRVFTAGRLDIALAALGVLVPFMFGTLIGTVVGATRRRFVDTVTMRLTDGVIAFPFVILILVIVVIIGAGTRIPPLPPGAASVLVAVWCVNWTTYARLARARTQVLRQEDFIKAARLLGFSQIRIVTRHLLPSVWPTTATYAVADALVLVSLIAALPFLGAGVQPPTPEWGSIMYEGRGVLLQAWWISLTTAGVLLVLGTGVMLVVDSLVSSPRRPRLP
ncbi:MAG: ABC transporter permease [Mesorhizobium sp.]|uniref:ABC transporter permease n=1 Tax=Mesorhizobium sp. TaxID=1871066 RepID=UPI0011F592B6|nr:ABC transporter permease [Mesorhizobium sp.]TIR48680.1 MAG: ABC transporter permease [Mesorhizobium sp.]